MIAILCTTGALFLLQERVTQIADRDYQVPVSFAVRLVEWERYYSQMEFINYFFGKGLGSTFLHVDGMFVKVFLDMGILGIFIFFLFYFRLLKKFKVIGIIVFLYCISLDFFTASKLMFGMYFAIYYITQQQSQLIINKIDYGNRLGLHNRHI